MLAIRLMFCPRWMNVDACGVQEPSVLNAVEDTQFVASGCAGAVRTQSDDHVFLENVVLNRWELLFKASMDAHVRVQEVVDVDSSALMPMSIFWEIAQAVKRNIPYIPAAHVQHLSGPLAICDEPQPVGHFDLDKASILRFYLGELISGDGLGARVSEARGRLFLSLHEAIADRNLVDVHSLLCSLYSFDEARGLFEDG